MKDLKIWNTDLQFLPSHDYLRSIIKSHKILFDQL